MSKLFICYSHKNEDWKNRIISHLGALGGKTHLEVWHDRKIDFGQDWRQRIQKEISLAKVAIVILCSDSLSSRFIREYELPLLVKENEKRGLILIPVISKPCPWETHPWIERSQLFPRDSRPLSTLPEHEADQSLSELAKLIAVITDNVVANEAVITFSSSAPNVRLAKLPATTGGLFGREHEIGLLDRAWLDNSVNVIVLTAWGGVGKTSLVNHWINHIEQQDYCHAERVLGWSFYSQGTAEDKQASSDEFIAQALDWFGDSNFTQGTPWDRGARLAGLIQKKRVLLILDGMEALQYPPGNMQGRLKDQAIQALLKELARNNSGLCIVTTRLPISDIVDMEPAVKHIQLENLSPPSGVDLLNSLGTRGKLEEMLQAVSEFRGHALALTLLGRYLAVAFNGDIRKRDTIPSLESLPEEKGRHARRVMKSYETWLKGSPELELLRILGLFDRPAESKELSVLRTPPFIKGLTELTCTLTDAKWFFVLQHLRDLRLLDPATSANPGSVDCHPLIREHFSSALRSDAPAAWTEANCRLFEHFRSLPQEVWPDTVEETVPLYRAISHGCSAGRYIEALNDIFWSRICRREASYSTRIMGAFAADLAALSNFFVVPWSKTIEGLPDPSRAFILGAASIRLRALARMHEAAEAAKVGLDIDINTGQWLNAAKTAGGLSEVLLSLGDIKEAICTAKRGVALAEKSDDPFQRCARRTTLAYILFQVGKDVEAEVLFKEAEDLFKRFRRSDKYIYPYANYLYCILLLKRKRYQEIAHRAAEIIRRSKIKGVPLDEALGNLVLGRTLLCQHKMGNNIDLKKCESYLETSAQLMRKASRQDQQPEINITWAELRRIQKNFREAWDYLKETYEIAIRSGMRIYLADYHIEAIKLCIAEGKKQAAHEHYINANQLLTEIGYLNRASELSELTGIF